MGERLHQATCDCDVCSSQNDRRGAYRTESVRLACKALIESLPDEAMKEASERLAEILAFHSEKKP